MIQDSESFETVAEVGAYIDDAANAFKHSPDFATASEGTMDYILTLLNSIAALSRIAHIEVQKRNLRLRER